jgi:hypothetical protein
MIEIIELPEKGVRLVFAESERAICISKIKKKDGDYMVLCYLDCQSILATRFERCVRRRAFARNCLRTTWPKIRESVEENRLEDV